MLNAAYCDLAQLNLRGTLRKVFLAEVNPDGNHFTTSYMDFNHL
jgi:hypothetical protein